MVKKAKKAQKTQDITKLYQRISPWQEYIAEALFIILLCVQPLYFGANRYIGLTGQKFWFFFSCMCAILLCTLIVWIYRLSKKPPIFFQDRLTVTDWAILGFAAVTLLSACFSPFRDVANVWIGKPEPDGRYDGAVTQLMYVSAFFIIAKWYRPRERDFVIFGFSALFIALIGIFQFHGMDFFKLWPNHLAEFHRETFYRIGFRSTLGNINIVSTYSCVASLLCGFLFIKVESKWRLLWMVASALSFWLMIVAMSDSGMVGTAVAAALALPYVLYDKKAFGRFLILGASWLIILTLHRLLYNVAVLGTMEPESRIPYVLAAAALLAAGFLLTRNKRQESETISNPDTKPKWKLATISILIVIIIGFLAVEYVGRSDIPVFYPARQIMHGNFDDNLGSGRIYIWRQGIESFPNYPVIGTGPDTYAHALPEGAHGGHKGNIIFDKAHNEYLQILICQGALGLVCYLVFLGGVFIKAAPIALKNPLMMALIVAFVGYGVQAFFNISVPIASQMMWVIAGLMANKRVQTLA